MLILVKIMAQTQRMPVTRIPMKLFAESSQENRIDTDYQNREEAVC